MSLFPFLFYNKGKLMPEGRKRGKKNDQLRYP